MSDPNMTIGPQEARASTGSRKAIAIGAIIEAKAKQAEHAAANPLRSLALALGHLAVGALLLGLGALALKNAVPWEVWLALMVAGLFAIAPATIGSAFKLLVATIHDAIALKKEATP